MLPEEFDQGLQVSVERYDLEMLVRGTPAEAWYGRRHMYNRSAYLSNHLADLLRLLTLFHRGGTYVDTDVIFTSALRRPAHCRSSPAAHCAAAAAAEASTLRIAPAHLRQYGFCFDLLLLAASCPLPSVSIYLLASTPHTASYHSCRPY